MDFSVDSGWIGGGLRWIGVDFRSNASCAHCPAEGIAIGAVDFSGTNATLYNIKGGDEGGKGRAGHACAKRRADGDRMATGRHRAPRF